MKKAFNVINIQSLYDDYKDKENKWTNEDYIEYGKLLLNDSKWNSEGYIEYGKALLSKDGKMISDSIEKCINEDNGDIHIDVEKLKKLYFPKIKADIFLSHSHKDIELVNFFVGYMQKQLKKKVFVDSNVWGNVYELRKNLYDDYAQIPGKIGSYYLNKSDKISDNLNIILASSLTEMIKNTNTFLFLSTDNSINDEYILNSPWIYHEIVTLNCFPIAKGKISAHDSKSVTESAMIFDYNIESYIKNLRTLDVTENGWENKL